MAFGHETMHKISSFPSIQAQIIFIFPKTQRFNYNNNNNNHIEMQLENLQVTRSKTRILRKSN